MRKNVILVTVDYEVWQWSENQRSLSLTVDWEEDLIQNTYKLLTACDNAGARATLFVEMGEYFWLRENNSDVFVRVQKQLQYAVETGHDVQLHLHPNWLPECKPSCVSGVWHWNWQLFPVPNYPGDLGELIKCCKEELEKLLRTVKSNYRLIAFRAGGYRVQPFKRIANALIQNGIVYDMSVWAGGVCGDYVNVGGGYNFASCIHPLRPYPIDISDICSVDNQSDIIEIPITTYKKASRWFFDNNEASVFGMRFTQFEKQLFAFDTNCFELIGHSKGKHDWDAIENQLKIIGSYPNTQFITGSDCDSFWGKDDLKNDKRHSCSIDEVSLIMNHLYTIILPAKSGYDRADMVLMHREGLCCGYTVTLYNILKQYGYMVSWVTCYAKDMPNGRGKKKIDTHELLELKFNSNFFVLDCTTNKIFPYSLKELLKNPLLANTKSMNDKRYLERSYFWYDTDFLYRRIIYYYRKQPFLFPCEKESKVQYIKRGVRNFCKNIAPGYIKLFNFWYANKSY